MSASDQDSFVTIAELGQLMNRCGKVHGSRRTLAKKPPTGPQLDLNRNVPDYWKTMAAHMGIPDKAHELPVLFESGLRRASPHMRDLLKQFLVLAKLGAGSDLDKHRDNMRQQQEMHAHRDRNHLKELKSYEGAQKAALKAEREGIEQVRTKWGHICKSLQEALRRVDCNPARLSPKDAAMVEILKRRKFVDVRNHTVDVRWGSLENLDSDALFEIAKAAISSLKGIEHNGAAWRPEQQS